MREGGGTECGGCDASRVRAAGGVGCSPPPPPTQLTLPPPLLQNLGQQNNNNQQPISIMDVLFFDIQLAASVVHSNRMLTGTTQLMFKG